MVEPLTKRLRRLFDHRPIIRRLPKRLRKVFDPVFDPQRMIKRFRKQLKKSKQRKRKAPESTLYQIKRSQSTVQRLELISAHLEEGDQSLLDIGCNLGRMTRFAADRGLFALGIDSGQRAIASASEANRDVPHLAFMRYEIAPETVAKLPSFDVILCLSVYHYWVQLHGETAAWSMVARLIERSRRKFFFRTCKLAKKIWNSPAPWCRRPRSRRTYRLSLGPT